METCPIYDEHGKNCLEDGKEEKEEAIWKGDLSVEIEWKPVVWEIPGKQDRIKAHLKFNFVAISNWIEERR